MKNILFCALLVLFFAGPSLAQVRFGIEGGATMSNMGPSASVAGVSTSALISYRAGALLDVGVSENIGVQLGAYYTVLGYKSSVSQSSNFGGASTNLSEDGTLSLNYIRVPLNFVYRMERRSGYFFIGGGPFLSYALDGNYKFKLHESSSAGGQSYTFDTSFKQNVSFNDSGSHNVGFGVGASLGYELNSGLFIRAGYELALGTLAPGTQSSSYCFNFTVGILFGHRYEGGGSGGRFFLPRPYNPVANP